MYRIPVAEPDPSVFSAEEQKELSKLMTQIKDSLLAKDGKLVSSLHYRSVIQRSQAGNGEQFGVVAFGKSPHVDRRQVLINKWDHWMFEVDFHVLFGQLTDDEKKDPNAMDKRREQQSTGIGRYSRNDFTKLAHDIHEYMLNGFLPQGIVRTN